MPAQFPPPLHGERNDAVFSDRQKFRSTLQHRHGYVAKLAPNWQHQRRSAEFADFNTRKQ
jgi:hypothetical protein